MNRVNALAGVASNADVTVTEFWEQTYLRHIERSTKASTIHGYKAIWRQHLAAAFAGFNLRDYETHHAMRYLTSLAEKGLRGRTIAHIRSLASGVLKHALRLKYIWVNPWRDRGAGTVGRVNSQSLTALLKRLRNFMCFLFACTSWTACGLSPLSS
jgi:hypothetical protein